MKKALVMLSGGADSTTALAHVVKTHQSSAIFFDFGQRSADFELAAARRVARHYDVPLEVVDVSGLRRLFLGLSDGPGIAISFRVRGPGEGRSNCPHGLFGVASTYCVSAGFDTLVSGMHADDVIGLNSPRTYFENWARGISELQKVKFDFLLPFLDLPKSEVIKAGASLGAPLAGTRSCDQGTEAHCGHCIPCIKRREAFKEAQLSDPTDYLSYA